MKEADTTPLGTIRFKTKDLKPYEKTKASWKKSKQKFPQTEKAIQLFKAHNNLKSLIDTKNKEFLKGRISPKGQIQGARLTILPNKKQLTGAYSIFAKQLTIHDETSSDHWDVMHKNPSSYCHLYTLEKKQKHKNKKYKAVKEFEKLHPLLEKKVLTALRDKKDYMSVPMYTLLQTYMRVGNETYYKLNGHKGLTTLKNKDVTIKKNQVTFKYIAKDGVPMTITHTFPNIYIKRLQSLMRQAASGKRQANYIFQTPTKNVITDTHFKKAFKKYIGKEFYPHIVRSFFATYTTEQYLKEHKKSTKKETQQLLTEIAHELGHKRFNKKTNKWKESYAVTVHSYIAPNLMKKLNSITK